MRKLSSLASALVIGCLLSSPSFAGPEKAKSDAKPYVTVNGQPVSQAIFDTFLAEQMAQGSANSPQLQTAVREELVRREVLAQEAKKRGLDKRVDVQGQMELARQAVLIRTLLSEYVRSNPISDDVLKQEYQRINAQLGGNEYKSRHILVESEADAKAIIEKLGKGEKIADLAKQSKDPGSRDNGGDLGWSSAGAYVPEFAAALNKLSKGEFTKEPVKTAFGYHVIQLDDLRPLTPPPFDEVKDQLKQRAAQAQVEALIKELRTKAKVN